LTKPGEANQPAFVSREPGRWAIHDGGLVDLAPTLLALLDIPVPYRMTGHSLLEQR